MVPYPIQLGQYTMLSLPAIHGRVSLEAGSLSVLYSPISRLLPRYFPLETEFIYIILSPRVISSMTCYHPCSHVGLSF